MDLTAVLTSVILLSIVQVNHSKTCCPDGWLAYHGSCYLFGSGKPSNFVTAENYCRQHGGHLMHPNSVRENAFIKTYLNSLKEDGFWLGITDENVEGIWQFYGTDTDVPFTDWKQGEPNSNGGDEDCAAFWGGSAAYRWFDTHCDEQREPLCEIE